MGNIDSFVNSWKQISSGTSYAQTETGLGAGRGRLEEQGQG